MQSNDILDLVISSLSRKRRRNRPQRRKLLLEQLESRELLTASVFSPNMLEDWPGFGTMPAMVSDTSDVFSSSTMMLSGAEGEADEGILPVIIDNGDLEYSEQGRWFTRIGGYQGDSRYAGTSNGPSTATWQQTLLPGTYTVKASWFGDLRHANDAPYRIYDGDTLLAEVRVDQTQDAFGVTMGGSSFETLATVNINSGLLRVVLSNDASDPLSNVVADAVRIERFGPMAVDDSFYAATDTTLDVPAPGVLVNDVTAPGRILSASLVSGPQYGTAVLHEDGSFAYTPTAGFVGTDSFTYRAFDGTSESNVATVTIHVQLPPVVDDQSVETGENLALDLVLTGTDPTGRALTFSIVTLPAHGVLDGAAPDLTYTPDTDYGGQDYFTFQVDNGLLTSGLATVWLTVHRINEAPVAEDDTYGTQRDTQLTVTAPGVLANDTDADGDLLTATLCTPPEHGQLTLNADGSFSYIPADGFAGEDSFTYRATDGALLSNIATVSLTVEATNRPPMAEDDAYGMPSDTPLTVAAPGVLGNDSDPDGDALTAVLVSGPTDGTLVLNTNGSFTYTPSAGFVGADSFTYRASDGVAESDIATVSITVVTVEKGPVAHWALDETSGTVGADATEYGNHLVLGPVGSEPIWGTGKLDGALIFDGVNDRADAANVSVDKTPGGKTTIAFWMNWNGGDDQMPVSLGKYDLWIRNDRFGFNTFNGDQLAITDFTAANYANKWIHVTAVFANADTSQAGWRKIWAAESKLYIDGVEQTLTQFGTPNARAAVPNITLGAAANDSSGRYYFGGALDEFRVYARELTSREVANLVAAASGLVANWTLDETSGTVGADATEHGNHLVLGPAGSEPTWGLGKLDGALVFDGVNDRADATNVPVDETAGGKNTIAFWMNWNGGNDQMPVSLGKYDLWIRNGRFGFNTFNGDQLAITDFTAANYANRWIHVTAVFANADTSQAGWQKIWAAESKLYIDGVEQTLTQFGTPNARAAVPNVTLGAAANDNSGRYFFGGTLDEVRVYARELTGRKIAKLAGADTPVENQPPVADDQSVETDQDMPVSIVLTGSDPDGDPLTFTIVDVPSHGILTGTAPALTYTPDAGYNGNDAFTFQVTDDGMLTSAIATVAITINAINTAPIAVNDAYSTSQDTTLTIAAPGVLSNDIDADGDSLSAVLVRNPDHGAVDLKPDGSFTYTPNAGYTGSDSFFYKANDGQLDSNIATVTITVVRPEEGLVAHWTLDDGQGTVASDSTEYGNQLMLLPSGSEPDWGPSRRGGALFFDTPTAYARAQNVPVNQTPGEKNTLSLWMNWTQGSNIWIATLGDLRLQLYNNVIVIGTGGGSVFVSFPASTYRNRWTHVAVVFANADTSLPDWEAVWVAENKLYIDGIEQTLTASSAAPTARIASSTVRLGGINSTAYDFYGSLDDVRIYSRELTSQDVASLYYPLAFDDTYLRDAELPLSVEAPGVLDNDIGVEGRVLTPSVVTQPEYGSVVLNADGSFVYTPNPDFTGSDSFTYKVNNGVSDSDEATVIITSNAPMAVDDDSYNTHLNTSVTYGASGGVLFNDTSMEGDVLTAVLVSGPSHGSLTLNSDGSFTYTPDDSFIGEDSFAYRAYNGTHYSNIGTTTIAVNEMAKPIPGLNVWESQMLSAGTLHGDRLLDGTYTWGAYFYDGYRVFHNIAAYTGDDSWLDYANKVADLWLDGYVVPNNGAIPPWENVTHGLTERYFLTGDIRSKDAVILISRNASYAPDYAATVLNYTHSREMAHVLNSYINAERLGEPRRVRFDALFEAVLGHIDQWIATKDNPYDDIYWSPFMIGLSSETLIYYWDRINQDPRILEKLQLIGDAMWEVAWQEEHQAFTYRLGESALGSGAQDLNLMIAPLYSWLYLQTGDATYRDRGDKVFASGAQTQMSWSTKTMNQNYRWSFDYLNWRSEAEGRWGSDGVVGR